MPHFSAPMVRRRKGRVIKGNIREMPFRKVNCKKCAKKMRMFRCVPIIDSKQGS